MKFVSYIYKTQVRAVAMLKLF